MKKVVIIPTNGEPYVQEIAGEYVDYDTLTNGVKGWIECVRLESNLEMWVNEEGKLIQMDYNPLATLLWEKYYGQTDMIMGPVVLTAGVDEEGETLAFDDNDVDSLTAMLSGLTK